MTKLFERLLDDEYAHLLIDGHAYEFTREKLMVVAKRHMFGHVWLLYEFAPQAFKLRYWVMPDGGIADAAEGGPGKPKILSLSPGRAHVAELRDLDEMDPDLRRQLDDLLRDADSE